MSNRRVYVYFALTFLLGILAGGAGAIFYGWHMMGPRAAPARRERILRHMTRELDLNQEQVNQIRVIMEETGDKITALRNRHRPEFDALLTDSRDRIREVLTPQQVTRFDEMVKKFEERHGRHEPPPPPPPE